MVLKIYLIVPQAFANIHDYNTRNASALPVVRTRTSLYYNYFIPSSVRLWNLQSDNITSDIGVTCPAIILQHWFSKNGNIYQACSQDYSRNLFDRLKIGLEYTTLVVISTDCIGNYKSNYHMIMTTKAPPFFYSNQWELHILYM
jgi:hypothetical protein